MATIVTTGKNAKHLMNPDAIYVTPLIDGGSESFTKGDTSYKLEEVIKDSTSITQDDPEVQKIENEFGAAPIDNNTTLGSYQFSAEVADMQSTLLEKLCGYVKGTTATDKTFAPSSYTPIYAEIALVFKTGAETYAAAVMPKVQLNAKATFESLSTNMGTITLAGTGLNLAVPDGDSQKLTPFYIDYTWTTAEL